MNVRYLAPLILALGCSGSVYGQYCLVSDPTGTPLNVRSGPNGRIKQSLKNDTMVLIEKTALDKANRPWVEVTSVSENGPTARSLGWVIREHLFCGIGGYVPADSVTVSLRRSAERDWPRFFANFRTAVISRDPRALAEMGLDAQQFLDLSKNKGYGWMKLEDTIKRGPVQNMFPAEARLYVDLEEPCLRDWTISFVVVNGRWRFEGFHTGCGP